MSGILSSILHGLSSFNNLKKTKTNTKTNLSGLKLPPPPLPPHHYYGSGLDRAQHSNSVLGSHEVADKQWQESSRRPPHARSCQRGPHLGKSLLQHHSSKAIFSNYQRNEN